MSKQVDDVEPKARVEIITDELRVLLPEDYPKACEILKQCLGPENTEETGMFKVFYWVMPIALFVEKYGLDHFKVSIKMIEEITKRYPSTVKKHQ